MSDAYHDSDRPYLAIYQFDSSENNRNIKIKTESLERAEEIARNLQKPLGLTLVEVLELK